MRRRRLVLLFSVVLLVGLAGVGAVVLGRDGERCGSAVRSLPAAQSHSPFLDKAQRKEQPDHDRDALVRELGRPGPFGEVMAAVGYHYEQWVQLSAFDGGLGVRTRDNPDFTMLSEADLRPRWSVHVSSRHSAYDADDRTYLVAPLGAATPLELVALDLRTGQRRWCAEPGGRVGVKHAFATQLLGNGDAVVLLGGGGGQEIVRLSADNGARAWRRKVRAADGDFLGSMGDGVLLAGGTLQFELMDTTSLARRKAAPALVALDEGSGAVRWRRQSAAAEGVQVVGSDPDRGVAIVVRWSADEPSGTLRALDRTGRELWSRTPERGVRFDSALRAGRVLVRSGDRWSAYDARSGEQLWRRTLSGAGKTQLLPYGFELDSMPLLDADHGLLATTTALRVLDLRDGTMRQHADLPADGINTTYWPYRVVVTDRLVAVATNTGAVVLRRSAG